MNIGFIGLGAMGCPICANLLKAGYSVAGNDVFDLAAREGTAALLAAGLKALPDKRAVAAAADVVFTSIPDDAVLRAVYLGDDGLVAAAPKGRIFVELSTVSPAASAEVAAAMEGRGLDYIRAPLTGSTVTAAAGKLGILCSGPEAAFETVKPILETFTSQIFYLGGDEQARFTKIVVNMMVGCNMQLLAEAMVLGEKVGLDWEKTVDVIAKSAAGSPVVNYKAAPIAKRSYEPAFPTRLMKKDFSLALDLARTHNVPIPVLAVTMERLNAAAANGMNELDWSSLILVQEILSGLEPKRSQ